MQSCCKSVKLSVSHHWKGDARQSSEAHVDLCGFHELLGPVDIETQSGSAYDAEHDEEGSTQAGKVLQGDILLVYTA